MVYPIINNVNGCCFVLRFCLSLFVNLILSHSLQLSNLTTGKEWCGLVLEQDEENVDALCDRAELFISHQMYEEAIKDYQTAKNIENHPQKVGSLNY